MKSAVIFCAFIAVLAGCSYYTAIQPAHRTVGDFYSVKTRISWNRSVEDNAEVWTVDGPLLQEIRFVNGLKDGEPLIPIKKNNLKLAQFKSHMTPNEILELVVATVKSLDAVIETENLVKGRVSINALRSAGINASTVEAINLRPQKFGSLPGFRFNLLFRSKEGLEYDGMVVGTTSKERLFLIIYTGTRDYYYLKCLPEVEKIISSIEIK